MANDNPTRAQRRRARRKAAAGRTGFLDNPTNKALVIGAVAIVALIVGYSIYTKLPSSTASAPQTTGSQPASPPSQPNPVQTQSVNPPTQPAPSKPVGEVKIEDIKEGSGNPPKPGDRVTVHYTGTLENGTKFDSSRDKNQPYTFTYGQDVIDGWTKGLATMKPGGRRKLVIPPDLGYGTVAKPNIPANSTLVFDIEMLKIEPSGR